MDSAATFRRQPCTAYVAISFSHFAPLPPGGFVSRCEGSPHGVERRKRKTVRSLVMIGSHQFVNLAK
jgi:hypothetical protein